jgi:histone-lysine N-methyltransferase MLL3
LSETNQSGADSDNNEDSFNTKQNALLKQLLQNCPSADSQSSAIDSIITETNVENETNKVTPKPESTPTEDSTNIVETPAINISLQEDIIEPQVSVVPTITSENTLSTSSSSALPTVVSPEKKLSYLDIRRAQLEREPTPPPEEIKPKRKRMPKRKEPKSPDGVVGDHVKPPTKKRSRKASQSRTDEDSELFFTALMAQLRALPPVQIMEPQIRPNHDICLPYDVSDLNSKDCILRGNYGNAFLSSTIDYYSTYPFGPNKAPPLTPSLPASAVNNSNNVITGTMSASGSAIGMPSTSRGFYNEEFAKNALPSNHSLHIPFPYKYENELSHYIRDCDSPDTIVSSSSPECVIHDYPIDGLKGLKFISCDDDEEDDQLRDVNNNRSSPDIPLMASIPIRPIPITLSALVSQRRISDLDFDKDKENLLDSSNNVKTKIGSTAPSMPLRDAGNVGVTLTLSSADDIRGILSSLAKYLDIPAPTTYEIVERTTTPPSQKLGLYNKKEGTEISDDGINLQNMLNGKMRFCRFCEIVVLNAGIKKKASELSLSAQEELEEDEEVMFCSTNCYMQFALSHRGVTTTEEKEAGAVVAHRHSIEAANEELKQEKPLIVKHPLDLLPPMSPMMEDDDISEHEIIALNLSPKLPSIPLDDNKLSTQESLMDIDSENQAIIQSTTLETVPKKWKELRYKYWNNHLFDRTKSKTNEEEEEEDEDDEAGLLLDKLSICVKPDENTVEKRKCSLCHGIGDGENDGPARLLNMDVDKWIHLNCALWSSEVYEMQNGGLMNVDQACKRAISLQCVRCHKSGASLKCFKIRCANSYHFPCAIKDQCMFFKDKTLLCTQHALKIQSPEEMKSFVVYRRVFVNRDEQKQIASMIHMGDNNLLRIGNLVFVNIGQLLPHQLQAFHTPNYIYPVGYKIIRFYWSYRRYAKRCKYICSINEADGRPEFNVEIKEEGFANVTFKDSSPKAVWLKILESIVKMRNEAKSIKVFTEYITGEDLFGLTEPSIVRILESLPGVDTLSDYHFRYGRSPLLELPLAINPTGCARSEPKLRTHFKRPHTLHVSTSNSSRSSIQSSFSGMEISSPYIKQFVHSKSSQYRKMKMEWRNNVYLARSRIQGLGLYAVKDIEKHTMVIEYIGLLIRNEIAERNERVYEEQVFIHFITSLALLIFISFFTLFLINHFVVILVFLLTK